MDDAPTPKLTQRQLVILSALIRTYTQAAEPVSSKQLVEDNELSVSSATVRNELVILEQMGMVKAPHTSAGRVPTEEGYRYFVRHLLTEQELSAEERRLIHTELEAPPKDLQRWVGAAAGVVSRALQTPALVTEPRARAATLQHLQLIALHESLVLLVVVLEGGDLLQHMLTLTEAVTQEGLSQISAQINDTCRGETQSGLRYRASIASDSLTQEVLDLVADVLKEAESGLNYVLHVYGLSDLLKRADESQAAQQVLRLLDERTLIQDVLAESIQKDDEPLRVIVGGRDELSDLSLVIGRYGTDKMVGAISVLGPIRMRYGRVISTVRYMSTLMSSMMQDLYHKKG
jgi:heat-inducible transcriptional repressor